MSNTTSNITVNGLPLDEYLMQNDPSSDPYDYEPYCFVCNRSTDHFAEHDDLVEAGLAEYVNGDVRRTDKWDDAVVWNLLNSINLEMGLL